MLLNEGQLREVGERIREHLEPCWAEFHRSYVQTTAKLRGDVGAKIPAVLSTFTCRHTSLFTIRLLKELGVDDLKPARGHMRVREGFEAAYRENGSEEPDRLSSLNDGESIWEMHSWIEHGGMFFDITADQFGYEPVLITEKSSSEALYRHNPRESKMSILNSVKDAADKFKGLTTSIWQDADPHFAKIERSYHGLREAIHLTLEGPRPKFS